MMQANVENRVVLGIRRDPREPDEQFQERVMELIGLCEAAGGEVVAQLVQERPDIDAAHYIGSGKVEEVRQAVYAHEGEVVVFDGELSPAQVRNLERKLEVRILDRTQLILDIFAIRAKSKEGRLQVEIAQLQYLMPRLTGRGSEMSRLGGGIGTRGPGETKLETDRRRIRQRIDKLRKQLAEVRKHRGVQRHMRTNQAFSVALVGYTNAGKTTLLNRWTTDRGMMTEEIGNNRLFDTLDPVARKVRASGRVEIVLLDTVGFVRDLPHLLVDAFRATLEEVRSADVIVHVIDGSTDSRERIETTYLVLQEIGVEDTPIVTFFNKMDMGSGQPAPDLRATHSIFGSAATGDNMLNLYDTVDKLLQIDPVELWIEGDEFSAQMWKEIGRIGDIIASKNGGAHEMFLRVPRRDAQHIREHLLTLQPDIRITEREVTNFME